jgi:hypothetical protein
MHRNGKKNEKQKNSEGIHVIINKIVERYLHHEQETRVCGRVSLMGQDKNKN